MKATNWMFARLAVAALMAACVGHGPQAQVAPGVYLYRMAGAILGIYANSQAEAMYPALKSATPGQPLIGANKYTLHFVPGQLPPVNAFWSTTMYGLPESLLVANPINRYLLNSPMLPLFAKDPDGGLTFYGQHDSPGKAKEANWLPSPEDPFAICIRLYWPKRQALDGEWTAPLLTQVQ